MFIIIKHNKMKSINTLVGGCPRFLTKNFDLHDRDITEKAVAHYIRDHGLTPKRFA